MATILVVDDEAAVRQALVAQLEVLAHRCDQASNGLEALQRLHEREYDLVVTDVMMPRMNGLQFMSRALPHIGDRTPVIVLSSVGNQTCVEAAMDAGAFDYLEKPTEMVVARRVIESALERRRELVRVRGRWRARGGPVPAYALGADKADLPEARPGQMPAGVPALRPDHQMVAVGPPSQDAGDASKKPWWARIMRRLRGERRAA